MAGRIRTIKPELLEDAKTAGLSDTAFRVFIALILLSDDYGNGRGEPRFLEGQVYWSASPEKLMRDACKELETLVTFYVVRGQVYAHINGWEKHQRVQHPGSPRVPRIEERDSGDSPETLINSRETLAPDLRSPISDHDPDHQASPRESPVSAPPSASPIKSRGTRLPEDWDPPTDEHGRSWREVARKRGLSTHDVSQAMEAFKDHWRAAAGQRGVKLDWDATWRNWLRSTRPTQQHTSGFRNGRDMGRPLPAEGYDWDAHERREKAEQAKAPIEVKAPAIGVRTEKRNAQPAAASVLSELMSKIGSGPVKPAREGAIGGATAEERALASRVALTNMGGGK